MGVLLSAGSLAALFDAIMTYSEALSLETKRMAARASTAVKKKAESFKDAVFGDSDSDGEGNGDGDGAGGCAGGWVSVGGVGGVCAEARHAVRLFAIPESAAVSRWGRRVI